jgi:CubicO group peptidase (beta-lactamase class C family)
MRRWWRPLTAVVAVVALAGAAWAGLAASTSRSQLARAIMWRESDMDDHRRFPARRVAAGSERFRFAAAPAGAGTPPAAVRRIRVRDGDRLVERDRRFGQITLRHLLTMTSGLRYEESGGPWGDDTATYYAPDLRALALRETEVVEEPGRRFRYNNFNPLLVGLALERATGMPVASYLERKLWQPLGMEADGSWSLDSERSGFEKMESGLNGRPVDFAKFGLLFAQDGRWRDRQLVPRAWVNDRTLVPTWFARAPASGYQYFWWVQDDRRPPARFALGKYAQHLYVVPGSDLVLVRFGRDVGYPHWAQLLADMAARLDADEAAG